MNILNCISDPSTIGPLPQQIELAGAVDPGIPGFAASNFHHKRLRDKKRLREKQRTSTTMEPDRNKVEPKAGEDGAMQGSGPKKPPGSGPKKMPGISCFRH